MSDSNYHLKSVGTLVPLGLFILLFLLVPQTWGLTAHIGDRHHAAAGLLKADVVGKADMALRKAHVAFLAQGMPDDFRPGNPLLRFNRGKVLVDAVAVADGSRLAAILFRHGLEKSSRYGHVVSGWLPMGQLRQVLAESELRSISASLQPLNRVGSVTSEGDAAMGSDLARADFVVDGSGIRVGVLSDSYDQLNGAAGTISSGDLPTDIIVLDDSASCSGPCTDEGRGMMEIIHDVAPGASLAFHTAWGGVADFAGGIVELATDAGSDVIVDDVLYFAEPMFQDGPIAQAVDQVVNSHGVAYFSSAGNAARKSYESPFVSSGEEFWVEDCLGGLGGCTTDYRGILHDFDPGPGVDYMQQITIPVGATIIVSFQWDSPFASVSPGNGSPNDLDIYLTDPSGGIIWAEGISDNIGSGEAVEVMQFTNSSLLGLGTSFNLMLAHFDGPVAGKLKYVYYGSLGVDEYATNSGTSFGHNNATGAMGVGAVYWGDTPAYGTNPPQLEYFSSAGGVPILFATDGTLLPVAEDRGKPDVCAPDGGSTTFFYSDSDGDGIPNFYGTSAAAPHAAGLAALLLDADGSLAPATLYAALESTALDMEAVGFDHDSGYGLVQAYPALESIGGLLAPTADFDMSVNGLQVDFTDLSSDPDGSVDVWAWNFGDGNGSAEQNPSHTYGDYGSYTVSLTVTDNGGATDDTSMPLELVDPTPVDNPPVAAFSWSCSSTACSLDATTSSDDGTIDSFTWKADGSVIGSGVTLDYDFGTPSTYNVELTVIDDGGQSGTGSADIRVKKKGGSEGSVTGDVGGGDTGGDTGGPPACKGKNKNDPGCP